MGAGIRGNGARCQVVCPAVGRAVEGGADDDDDGGRRGTTIPGL